MKPIVALARHIYHAARSAATTALTMLWLAAWAPVALAADIVDTAYVADALDRGAIVWDVRDTRAYQAGHIPGAVNLGDIGAVLRDPNREDWLPAPRVQEVLGTAGIDLPNREVIVYGRAGDPNAYHALLAVRHFGGRSGKVYHGGLDAWTAAGRPATQTPTVLPAVALKLQPVDGVLLWNEQFLQRVRDGRTQLIDARSPAEYSGNDVRAIRGGHVPKAINRPFEDNLVDPRAFGRLMSREITTREGMALKDKDALAQLYADLDKDKEVVVYCQSGVRASVTASVMRDLGFKDVKVYEPSWLGYAGLLAEPAEQEVFLNVGALNGRIAVLLGRVNELEAELGRVKAAR